MQTFEQFLLEDKSWIGVDLDSTLAYYTHFKKGEIGKPIPKMVNRVKQWIKEGKKVKIFTARADDPKEIKTILQWLKDNDLPKLEVTNIKDKYMVKLWDDRAVTVQKNTGEVIGNQEMFEETWKNWLAAGLIGASTLGVLPSEAEAANPPHRNHSTSHVHRRKTMNVTPTEAIAKTLWAEARGEGINGINAVASVVFNRAKGKPSNVIKVITTPKQFSSWNAGVPTVTIRTPDDQKMWDYCQKIAKEIIIGTFKPSGEWTHYYNPKVVTPKWAHDVPYTDIGRHRFLKIS